MVSRDGPSTSEVANSAGQHSYVIVDLTKDLSNTVQAYHDQTPLSDFTNLPPAKQVGQIGTGDVLHITIWEATTQQGGVFAQGHGADVVAVVDDKGEISVPYAGRFSVAGLPLSKIEPVIMAKLKGKVYSPQASVQLAENTYNTVFLQGEIGHPGRFPLTPGGNKLLDLIALAGGPRLQPHETTIQIVRQGEIVSTDLFRIMNDPQLNVILSPGDSVVITRRMDRFYAFGAVNHVGELPFSQHTTTLLQALGSISGLRDDRADPKGVFIFRQEPAELVNTLTTPPNATEPLAEKSSSGAAPAATQVVYRINMEDPNSFFILNAFPIRPSDIIYVSNAPLREFQKVVDSVFGATGNLLNTGLQAATLSRQ